MQYQITSDNMETTPSMVALAKQKFARVEHRLRDIDEGSKSVRIVMDKAPNEMFTVRAKLNANGKEYFSDETDFTLESALIKAVEELLQMMQKEMDYSNRKDVQPTAEELLEAESEPDTDESVVEP